MLLEENPKLAIVDLVGSGSASDYRIMDFRKPMLRFCGQDRSESHQVQDFPVFNGKYSTTCYIDETLHALADMYEKRGLDPSRYLRSLEDRLHASPVPAHAGNRLGHFLPVCA